MKTVEISEKEIKGFRLQEGEYIAVTETTPGRGYGYNYTTHRSLNAAYSRFKQLNRIPTAKPVIEICANSHPVYRVSIV